MRLPVFLLILAFARRRVERDRARDERQTEITLPVRTSSHSAHSSTRRPRPHPRESRLNSTALSLVPEALDLPRAIGVVPGTQCLTTRARASPAWCPNG